MNISSVANNFFFYTRYRSIILWNYEFSIQTMNYFIIEHIFSHADVCSLKNRPLSPKNNWIMAPKKPHHHATDEYHLNLKQYRGLSY